MPLKQFKCLVHGKVQGVAYRDFAKNHAWRFEVTGYVRNLADGTVEIVAEGTEEATAHFLEVLRRGPEAAKIEKVDVAWGAPSGAYHQFKVLF